MVAIIPMAGRGSRYAHLGFDIPKPLINVAEKPMILWALESIANVRVSKYVFVLLLDHENRFQVSKFLSAHLKGELEFIFLRDVTEGQLCTVLEAEKSLDRNEDVLIASSDTLVRGDLAKTIQSADQWDGIISVADLPGDQWSFARTNEKGEVTEVEEKTRISDNASTGLYYFRKASTLIDFGKGMIENREKVRGEYYVIPVFQKMIKAGMKVGISVATEMWDMGTPAAKSEFERKFAKGK